MTKHYSVVGLVFGDEAKGATVDWLASQADGPVTVVRYSGGCQAAHNVVVGDKHHTFRQFGSGTLAGAYTHFAPKMMVEPILLAHEADVLERDFGIYNPIGLLSIDPECLVTTEFHRAANRTREDLRENKHGSTGNGIGETTFYYEAYHEDAMAGDMVGNFEVPSNAYGAPIHVRDCLPGREAVLLGKLQEMAKFYQPLITKGIHMQPSINETFETLKAFGSAISVEDTIPFLTQVAKAGQTIIFEGSQGALLDQTHGFHPYTTWSSTTGGWAGIIAEDIGIELITLGVTRTYTTRHGAGPLPTEADLGYDEVHNGTGRYQGAWRDGHFDARLFRMGCNIVKPDGIVLTHMDRWDGKIGFHVMEGDELDDSTEALMRRKVSYLENQGLGDLIKIIQSDLNTPVVATASGPDRNDRQWR